MRSTIKQLMDLQRSGADLNEPEPAEVPKPEPPSIFAARKLACDGYAILGVRSAPAIADPPGAVPLPGSDCARTANGPPGRPESTDRRPEIHTHECKMRIPSPAHAPGGAPGPGPGPSSDSCR